MRCPNCYNEIPEGSKFCQACGAPIAAAAPAPEPPTVPVEVIPPAPTYDNYTENPDMGQPTYQAPASDQVDKKAIGSLVCGIIGFFIFGLILGILALVLGFQVRKTAPIGSVSRGMATAGIVLGIVDLLGYVLALFVCGGLASLSGMM